MDVFKPIWLKKSYVTYCHVGYFFATGDTPVCDWIFEYVDNIAVQVVLSKHFFNIFS